MGEGDDTGSWEDETDAERVQYEPWLAAYSGRPDPGQEARLGSLNERDGYALDPHCYVAPDAHVVAARLSVGEYTTIAAGCVIRGDVTIGSHCSLNAGASTPGEVTIGDTVRIAAYAVLVGENHGIDDLETPIAWQPMTSKGVVIEDDVWIGAHVTVVDGVTVGAHSVLAAGAVVTHDVPPWSIVAGVPARVIGDRRDRAAAQVRREPLSAFDRKVTEQWPDVLERCRTERDGEATYVDVPGAGWTPRPLNDAIEIAGAFGAVPPVADRDDLVVRIQRQQDPVTGMFVDPRLGPAADPLAFSDREWDMYGVISCGYALEVLGSGPAHPIHAVESCTAEALQTHLDGLDWGYLAWPSGSWIDGFATAAYLNRRHHGSTNNHPMLWGWLATHVDPTSGMWGTRLDPAGDWDFRWLMAVNGYYRLTRGTYAQFGVALPHAEAAIDTVLTHCRDFDLFTSTERNACNVLDIVHPLWLLGRQTDHRAGEIRDVAGRILLGAVGDWVDGAGTPWETGRDEPGLQGTEMWLSITYLAADILGESAGLGWRPRGVHRLEPATPWPRQ